MHLSIRRKLGLPLLSLLLSLAGCEREPRTLEQLIARQTQAVGGRAAIEAVHSIRVDLHIVDPGFEVDGMYLAARPGRMRIDITAQGRHVYTEALSETHAWQWKGTGEPVAESAVAAAALRHGVEMPGHLFGLHEMQARGHRLELAGREQIEGVNYYALRLTFADGFRTALYVDPESWLITRRRDLRPLHPDKDPTPTLIETRLSDFRRVGDLLFAFASADTDLASGKTLETTTVRGVTINPPLAPGIFEKL